ncbi:MAG: hypothetical protein QM751_10045 [Paludibacteraceae bacterium]
MNSFATNGTISEYSGTQVSSSSKKGKRSKAETEQYDLASDVQSNTIKHSEDVTVSTVNYSTSAMGQTPANQKSGRKFDKDKKELTLGALHSVYANGGKRSMSGGGGGSISGLIAQNLTNTGSTTILTNPQLASNDATGGGDPGGDPSGNPIPLQDGIIFLLSLLIVYYITRSVL